MENTYSVDPEIERQAKLMQQKMNCEPKPPGKKAKVNKIGTKFDSASHEIEKYNTQKNKQ